MSLLTGVSAEETFTKLMRYFCSRIVQTVVQSRMVCEVCQPSVPYNDSNVWFNLIVDEIGEIAAHLKQKMEKYSPTTHPFYLEFTMHTADGDYLPVELWVIWVDFEHADENVDVHLNFYPQLTTLLKSVIMASRFTPIYRHYARKQNADSFVILYKVSVGHPDVSILGEERKFRQLGNLPTPFGSVRMDLHYRTKMEILPSQISPDKIEHHVEEVVRRDGEIEHSNNSDLYGNVVPAKGSSIVASSPALEDVNCFSSSPLSQEFPFVGSVEDVERACFKLDRSSSTATTEASDGCGASVRHPSGGSLKSDTNSPKASNSFPQRSSKQMRIRNNSFPFASLLVMDLHSSSDQFRSQILPKVPEDAAITVGLHSSSSDRVLCHFQQKGAFPANKRHSSLTFDSSPILTEASEELAEAGHLFSMQKDSEEGSCDDKTFHTKKKVVFGCSLEEEDGLAFALPLSLDDSNNAEKQSQQRNHQQQEQQQQQQHSSWTGEKDEAEVEEDRQSCSSDDSYVKVVPFTSDSLYSDLTDFAQEVHLAPRDLTSCIKESTSELSKQIDEFRERASVFDSFVAGLRELDEDEQ